MENIKSVKLEMCSNLITKAIQVTENTNVDIFVNYSGHVNWISIDIHEDGWKADSSPDLSYMIRLEDEYEYDRAERRLYGENATKERLSANDAYEEICKLFESYLKGEIK